jgi:hypothetical protein
VKCLFRISVWHQLFWDMCPGLSQFVQKTSRSTPAAFFIMFSS